MSEHRIVEAVIKQARSKVIQNATAAEDRFDVLSKIDWQHRRLFLDSLLREFSKQRHGRAPRKSVFISYSVNSGLSYFESLKERLTSIGFDVLTGFQKSPGDKGNVLARVLGQLRRSTIYLGILTKEMQVKGPEGEELWSPSVWTMEEKGMALALGKPFALMVQKGIHDNYWDKTTPEKVHVEFTSDTFDQKAAETVETIRERYEELLVEYLGQSETLAAPTEILADRDLEE